MNKFRLYHQLAAFVFLTAFLAQTFSRTFVIVDYYTNTSQYLKNCENKARPVMKCNGKCQVMKKLQQEEKKDQENPERKPDYKPDNSLSTKSFFASVPDQYFSLRLPIKLLPSSDGKSTDRSFDIFHPPQV